MGSRFGATLEHVWKDYAHDPTRTDLVEETRGAIGTIAAKTYDAISGITPSIIGLFSSKEAQVMQRDGITAGTRAAISNTLNAQWIKKGPLRVLNIVPKALTGIVELPDGLIRDGIQIVGGGRKNDGYIVKYV